MRYLIGTRGSKLALVQTDYVIDKLKRAYPDDDFKAVIIKTTGDLEQKKALDKIGSKGIFVKEIEDELLSGKIHMAVHSMKDMPDEPAAGLTFAKAWKREDPRDVLVLKNAASLDELPHGAVIGTGSKRRKYQQVSRLHLGNFLYVIETTRYRHRFKQLAGKFGFKRRQPIFVNQHGLMA